MPETNYLFSKSGVRAGKLHIEINAYPGIAPSVVRIDYADPNGIVVMADTLTGAEQTALTNVIAAHPSPYPEEPLYLRSPNGALWKLRVTAFGLIDTDLV